MHRLNSFTTNRRRYLEYASSHLFVSIHLTLIGIFPVTSLHFWTATFLYSCIFWKCSMSAFRASRVRVGSSLQLVTASHAKLVVSFCLMAPDSTFVGFFHVRMSSMLTCVFMPSFCAASTPCLAASDSMTQRWNGPSVDIFFSMFLATTVDKTAAEIFVILRYSTSVKYFMLLLLNLQSLPLVACNYECRIVLDEFSHNVSIVNVTWAQAPDFCFFVSSPISSSLRVLTVPRIELLSSQIVLELLTSSRPCSSSNLLEVPPIALLLLLGSDMCTSKLVAFGTCFVFLTFLLYLPFLHHDLRS